MNVNVQREKTAALNLIAATSLSLMLLISGCGDGGGSSGGGGGGGGVSLVRIDVTPTNSSIAKDTQRQFTASGYYSNNTTQDLTASVVWASSNDAIATISNSAGSQGMATASAVNSGIVTISAAFLGRTGATSLTVSSATLSSIQVTPTSPSAAAGTSRQFMATGIYSDNSTQDLTSQVTWSSSAMTTATISTSGLATTVGAGSTTISAIFSGVTGTSLLTVTSAVLSSIEVTPTNPTIPNGTTRQFTATGVYGDNTTQDLTSQVVWSSSNTSVATIGPSGMGTAVGQGQTTITATLGGVSGITTLTVTPPVLQQISVTPPNPSIALGTARQFIATGIYSDLTTQDLTTQATWSTSSSSIATVSNASGSKGLATSIAKGQTSVRATLGITGLTNLTVTDAVLQSIAVTSASSSIPGGSLEQYTATGTYSDGSTQDLTTQVAWTSSIVSVATVSNVAGSQGKATAVAAGTTTISAGLGAVTGSKSLTVTAATLSSLSLSPSGTASMSSGTNQQFTATGTYFDASTRDVTALATWSSSDPTAATVSNAGGSQGLVTAVSAGSANIQARLSGVSSASTAVTVYGAMALQSISVTPASPSVAKGLTQQFTATGTYFDGTTTILQDITKQVMWSSTVTTNAVISNAAGTEGLATVVYTGLTSSTTQIRASLGGKTGSTTMTVNPAVLQAITVTPDNASIAGGTSLQFIATGRYSDNSTKDITSTVTWSDTHGAASISAGGLVSSTVVGSNTTGDITATSGTVFGSTPLTVTNATLTAITISPDNPSISLVGTQQFTATGTFSDLSTQNVTAQTTWSSGTPAYATINSSGLASAVSAGMTVITATFLGQSDTTNLTVSDTATAARAYVTNNATGNSLVYVIDTANNTVTGNITVGQNPIGVALHAAANRLYVANFGSNTVSVVDTVTNQRISTITVGTWPYRIALHTTAKRAYVTNAGSNSVSVINTDTSAVVATVPVGSYPQGIAVNAAANRAYVANFDGNTVSVIDTTTNTIVGTAITVGAGPIGCGLNAGGSRLYVTNQNGNSVSVIDTSSNTVIATISDASLINPFGVAVHPSTGRAYVANWGGKSISVIDPGSNTVIATVSVGAQPYGVAISGSINRAYVANRADNTVSIIDTTSNTLVPGINPISVGSAPGPAGVAVTP